MQKPKPIVGSIVVVTVAIAWYLFRRELLFVTKMVSEPLPGSAATDDMAKNAQVTVLARRCGSWGIRQRRKKWCRRCS